MTRVTDKELTGQIRTRALLVLLAMLVLAPGVVGCGVMTRLPLAVTPSPT